MEHTVQCAPLSWQWLLLTEWRESPKGSPLNRDLLLLSEWRSPKAIDRCDRRCQEAIITIPGGGSIKRQYRRWKERVESFQTSFLSSSGASY